MPSKNAFIEAADACGLAVNTNTSLLPNLSIAFLIFAASGPGFPSITLLNSLKSNSAPCSSN